MLRELLKRHKAEIVLLGDMLVFYIALAGTILLRYGFSRFESMFLAHVGPFTVLLGIWLLVFYIADLYGYKSFRLTPKNSGTFGIALLAGGILSMTVFYIFGSFFEVTPKTNLLLFVAVFALLDYLWRYTVSQLFKSNRNKRPVFFLAQSPLVGTLLSHLATYPELGYVPESLEGEQIASRAKENPEAVIVIDHESMKQKHIVQMLYELLPLHIEVVTLSDFYEQIMERVPLSELEEEWFVQEIAGRKKHLYDILKRVFDIFASLSGMLILSPFLLLSAIAVKATSKGPIIYRQERIGKDGKPFMLYKFRTMSVDAEKDGATWWGGKNDTRVTSVGKILRHTHLDEIPQLINILVGEVSLVGPRPERPEFIEVLKENIPHYFLRHTLKPGLTGWAQVKYHYGGSVEETKIKIEYDLFYLKHRSIIFDLFVIAKTVRKII